MIERFLSNNRLPVRVSELRLYEDKAMAGPHLNHWLILSEVFASRGNRMHKLLLVSDPVDDGCDYVEFDSMDSAEHLRQRHMDPVGQRSNDESCQKPLLLDPSSTENMLTESMDTQLRHIEQAACNSCFD